MIKKRSYQYQNNYLHKKISSQVYNRIKKAVNAIEWVRLVKQIKRTTKANLHSSSYMTHSKGNLITC